MSIHYNKKSSLLVPTSFFSALVWVLLNSSSKYHGCFLMGDFIGYQWSQSSLMWLCFVLTNWTTTMIQQWGRRSASSSFRGLVKGLVRVANVVAHQEKINFRKSENFANFWSSEVVWSNLRQKILVRNYHIDQSHIYQVL